MIDYVVTISRYVATGAICLAIGAYSASDQVRPSPTQSASVRLSPTPSDSPEKSVQLASLSQVVPIEAKVRGHLTTSELAKVLHCSTRHVVRMIHEGTIPGKQESKGKNWKIPLSVLIDDESLGKL